jgi:hypothetical protein
MFRRISCRAAVLVLVASLGTAAVPAAGAAQTRGGTGSAIQMSLSLRTFVYNMIDFLRSLSATKNDPPPPNQPGNDPPDSGSREGSSGNPLGPPPGHP